MTAQNPKGPAEEARELAGTAIEAISGLLALGAREANKVADAVARDAGEALRSGTTTLFDEVARVADGLAKAADPIAYNAARLPVQSQDTFVGLCTVGKASAGEVDDFIEVWHEYASPMSRPLHVYLGMSNAEYAGFIHDPRVLEYVVADRIKRASENRDAQA